MHSLSESLDLTCGECGRALAFELWLIVDAGERPDLFARARAGDLHTVTCPTCGPLGEIDAPLLLYLPDHNPATGQPPLLFSPARQTSQEQDQQMAVGLLRELAGRLGAAWQDDWLAQVASVRRNLLPVALSDDPAATLREHLAQERGDAEARSEEEDDDAELPPAVVAALTEIAATLAAEGVQLESPDDLAQALAARPELAARLEAAMRAAMTGEDEENAPAANLPGSSEASGKVDDDAPADDLPDLLNRFIAAQSWDESQRIVEAHPELLREEADTHLAVMLAEYAANPDAVTVLTEHRTLLRRCREAGIARAFAEKVLNPDALAEAARLGLTPEEFLAQLRATRRSEGADLDIPPEVQPLIAELSRLTQRTDMPRRIELCRQALLRVERGANLRLWAALQVELGNSYAQSLQGGRAENIEAALDAYQQALQVRTRQAMPVEWAQTMMNLATAYYSRIRGDKAENIEAALDAYQQALQVMTRQAMPTDYLRVARALGCTLFDQTRYTETLAHLQAVLSAAEEIYEAAPTPESRQSLLQEVSDTPQRLAFAQCCTDDVDGSQQAVVVLEQNRARWLREALEMRTAQPANVSAALWLAYQTQAQTVRELQAEAQLPDHTPGRRTFLALSTLLGAARTELRKAVDAIRTVAPDFLPKPSFSQIQAAAQDGPLVYLLATSAGGLALIVQGAAADDLPGSYGASGKVAGAVEAVWLDGLTEARLREWLVGPAEDPALGGWLGAYQSWLNTRTPAARDHWRTVIDVTLRALWDVALAPVAAALAAHQSLISNLQSPISQSPISQSSVTLIPLGLLPLLPLHAAWTEDTALLPEALRKRRRTAGSRTYFLDCFDVAYASSATALRHARTLAKRIEAAAPDALLAIDEPRVTGAGPLPNSAAEVTAIVDLFATPQVLRHAAATRDAVLAALPNAAVAHFSCHGNTNWQDALQSGLLLANGARLTVGDLLDKRLPGARLITLSACETGIVGTKLPDETVALPAALTQAGFAGVAASLWSVYDISTAMLMVRFYELWRTEGLEPPAALAAAQRWVRDTTNAEKAAHFGRDFLPGGAKMSAAVAEPFFEAVFQAGDGDERTFDHPVWWAAFTYTGV